MSRIYVLFFKPVVRKFVILGMEEEEEDSQKGLSFIFDCPRCPVSIQSDDIYYLASELREHRRHCSGFGLTFILEPDMIDILVKEGQL